MKKTPTFIHFYYVHNSQKHKVYLSRDTTKLFPNRQRERERAKKVWWLWCVILDVLVKIYQYIFRKIGTLSLSFDIELFSMRFFGLKINLFATLLIYLRFIVIEEVFERVFSLSLSVCFPFSRCISRLKLNIGLWHHHFHFCPSMIILYYIIKEMNINKFNNMKWIFFLLKADKKNARKRPIRKHQL